MILPAEKKYYTYHDYLSSPDDERWEIINGKIYDMTPAPSTDHQRVVWDFGVLLNHQLREHYPACLPFNAPTDVILDEENVVQPDIVVVCEKDKVKQRGIFGIPDLVVEVLSPRTASKDKRDKRQLYERAGVKEYLIVDPLHFYVEHYHLEEGRYSEPEILGAKDKLKLIAFSGVEIPLEEVFRFRQTGAESIGEDK